MQRLATASLLGLAWLVLLQLGGLLIFWLVLLVLAGLLLQEFCRMALTDFTRRDRAAVVILGLLPVVGAYLGTYAAINSAVLLAFLLLFLHIFSIHPQQKEKVTKLLFRGTFAIVYLGAFSAQAFLIRRLDDGADWLLFLTLVIIASDSGAFYGGTFFGRHKLCPSISPGKTVEGLICGISAAMIAGVASGPILVPAAAWPALLLLSLLLALAGVVGDLIESIIKRSSGVKDSGTLLPGHGGLFDRLDAVLLCIPVLSTILSSGLFP